MSKRQRVVQLYQEKQLTVKEICAMMGISKPTLYGILWDPGGKSLALINDAEAKVGDTVGGYQVKEIRKDAVVLVNGGEPVVLKISFDAPAPSQKTTKGGGRR